MQRRVPPTAKIEHCVGWRPATSLNMTINLIAEFFRQRQNSLAYSSPAEKNSDTPHQMVGANAAE